MMRRKITKSSIQRKRKRPFSAIQSEQDRIAELRNTIEALNDRIVTITTFDESLRRVIELFLRTIGLYDFVLRHRKRLNGLYELTMKIVGRMISLFRRAGRNDTPSQAPNSPEIDAFLNAHTAGTEKMDSSPALPPDRDQIADLRKNISVLKNHIADLTSFEASLRRVIVILLRRIGLYGFMHHHKKGFNAVFTTTLRTAARIVRKTTNESSLYLALNSPEVDVFIAVQSTEATIDNSTIDYFLDHHSSFSSVICLMPNLNDFQLLAMFGKLKKSVLVLEAGGSTLYQESFDVTSVRQNFEEWLKRNGRAGLMAFDLVMIGGYCPEPFHAFLRQYLPSPGKLLVNKGSPAAGLFISSGRSGKTVGFYTWLDVVPDSREILRVYRQRENLLPTGWPWKNSPEELPPTMPSGKPWPKISIVTVTKNQGEYIEETIRSVLMQQYPNLEYILLDGGSTDATPSILKRYKNKLSICISQHDNGQADALNKGFRYATGDIMAWLNSDDRYLPTTLIDVALAFDSFGCDMIAGGCALAIDTETTPRKIHHNSMPIGRAVSLPLERLLDIDGSWQKGDFFYQCEVFWTRNIWEKAGARIDTTLYYAMDYELWVRMAAAGATIVHLPETLSVFRVHSQQKTKGDDLPFLPELRRLNARLIEGLRSK